MLKQRPFLVEALTALGLIAAPFVLPYLGAAPNTVNRILVWGLFGIGFDILFGYTGLLSFGQSAFYGTGGFVAAYLLTRAGFPYVVLALIIGMVAAAVVGYLIGLLALRRTGIYFAMITVAIAEIFFFVEFNPLAHWTGGENGLPGVPTPTLYLGFTTIQFTTGWSLYPFLALCYFIGIVLALRIVRSPVGAIFSAIRENPLRAAAVGHNVHGYKLTAFVIAAAYAGLAGGLLGVLQAFMPPDAFMFDTSGQLVMQTAIGGRGTLFGPLVGAAVWLFLQDFLQATLGLGAAWKLVLGLVFVLLVFFLRQGIIGGIRDLYRFVSGKAAAPAGTEEPHRSPGSTSTRQRTRLGPRPAAQPSRNPCRRGADRRSGFTGPILQATGLTKHYGGVIANADIDFTVNQGELRGIIGPNGAGKIDVLQDADLRGAALVRQDRVRGPRHHRHERHRRVPARPDQELPGQPALQPPDGAREPHHRGARRAARQVQARHAGKPPEDSRIARAGRAHARAGESRRAPRHAGVAARLRREAAARSGPCAGVIADPAAAGRTARRHEPERARRNREAAQVDRRGPHHDHHRPRHGRAVRAGRAHHRAAGRPRAGRRHAGRDQGQRAGAGGLPRRRARGNRCNEPARGQWAEQLLRGFPHPLRRLAARGAQRGRGAARTQWRRQEHDPEEPDGRGDAAHRLGEARRGRARRQEEPRHRASRHAAGARRPPHLRQPQRRGKPDPRRR